MAEYRNPENLRGDAFTWDPTQQHYEGEGNTGPDFLGWLMNWRTRTPTGKNPGEVALAEAEQDQWRKAEAAARAIPMRDTTTLTAGWRGVDQSDPTWWTNLAPTSPDAAPILLALRDKLDAGTATPQERELYDQTLRLAGDWSARASRPDPWNPLGDQFFGALGTLALGATGGLAAAPLAAGGAGLASTLGSLGTLSGIAGTGAGVLGQATDQEWLQRLGMGLGAAGGIAGGIGGLANLAGTGVKSLSDAARLASNAGRVVGGVGSIADNDALKQAGGWLGTAGQLGGGVENLLKLVGGTGGSLQGVAGLVKPLQKIAGQFMQPGGRPGTGQPVPRPAQAAQAAPQRPMYGEPAMQPSGASPGAGTGGIQALLQAAGQAQQRGGALMDQDWLRQDWRLRNPAARSTLWNLGR